jgi:hypothetical protein
MSTTKFLKCSCTECKGHIEYPADAAGATIECPHCQKPTLLTVEAAAPAGGISGRSWKFWVILGALAVLVLLAVAVPVMLKRVANHLARKASVRAAANAPAATNNIPAAAPASPVANVMNDFETGPVTIDKSGSILYAEGALKNTLTKQRFSVRVDLELLDSSGRSVGAATDYAPTIEANAEWKFRAMVLKKEAATARVTRIREQK